MQQGFFSRMGLSMKAPDPVLPQCGACGLLKKCKTPKMPVYGQGKRKVMIVGEAPGADEDDKGRPFIGRAGQRLRRTLSQIGVDMDRDCWTTNSLICRPPGNETPTDAQIGYCRPNLINAIKEHRTHTVILLGGTPVSSLIGWLWRSDPGGIFRWQGCRIPCQRINAWVCPTFHPSYLVREDNKVLDLIFQQDLEKAFKKTKPPWKTIPKWESKVRVELDADKAAERIAEFTNAGKIVAFDYETDRLKPDSKDARIVSCSVSDGEETIAYPWHGAAVDATWELLRSDVPKIAANLKFEERWTQRILGKGVRNWAWDTMIAAHIIDNRPEICGLKFQAFAMLGQESWDDSVKPKLKARGNGGNSPNRIADIPLQSLLRYNGMDSLMEYKIAMKQMRYLGKEE